MHNEPLTRAYATSMADALLQSESFKNAVIQCIQTYDDMLIELTPDEVADHMDDAELTSDILNHITSLVHTVRS